MVTYFRKALATVSRVPATISIALVRAYQLTLSPDHGPLRHLFPYGYCRHEPTCSQYAMEELKRTSYPLALFRIAKRIASCNPWTTPDDAKLRSVVAKTLQNS